MGKMVVVACFASLAFAGAAGAQAAPQVSVGFGPAVEARANGLGREELDEQRASLERQVVRQIEFAHAPIRRVDLQIVDIQPNRPTSRQLGDSATLNADSFGLGGAAIVGEVTTDQGVVLPVRYRFFPPNLANETNFDTWGDAQSTFAIVARGIGKGDPPDQRNAWPAPTRPYALTGSLIVR